MAINRLELRSRPRIALAYLLGPFVGLSAWWAVTFVPAMHEPQFSPEGATTAWILTIALGSVICVAVELLVVTPLLIGFERFRWPWLNGWTGPAIGFLLGAVPWLVIEAPNPTPSPNQMPGSVTTCSNGHCIVESWAQAGLEPPAQLGRHPLVWEIDGRWTAAGWGHVVYDAAMMGMVGLIPAVVFRLVAVRSSPDLPAPDVARTEPTSA